jgi:hypothetical protein
VTPRSLETLIRLSTSIVRVCVRHATDCRCPQAKLRLQSIVSEADVEAVRAGPAGCTELGCTQAFELMKVSLHDNTHTAAAAAATAAIDVTTATSQFGWLRQ